MKRLLPFILAALALASCAKSAPAWYTNAIKQSTEQLQCLIDTVKANQNGDIIFPRSTFSNYDMPFLEAQLGRPAEQTEAHAPYADEIVGRIRLRNMYDWTSGFYPATLWVAYRLATANGLPEAQRTNLLENAKHYTNLLAPLQNYGETHDLGFMVGCPFGEALKTAPADTIEAVIIQTSKTLCGRFDSRIGLIRSWDFGPWNYPVIIDNMMNLDMLFLASKLSGSSAFYDVCRIHANNTIANHFRPDMTSYHVVSYNDDGTVESKGTHQGKNDDSAWARGQAWGVYGYTSCYRETGEPQYLEQAKKIADMIMARVTPKDKIPYWDYDAPDAPETPRDASAAAVTASALITLAELSGETKYADYAEGILKSLSSPQYLAKPGTNNGYVLLHSVTSLPHGTEIDQPLMYADYYYLEAMEKYRAYKGF